MALREKPGTDCVFPSATTAKDRLKATGYVTSAFEIIDARIQRIEHPNFAGAGA